jgi:hypothetical protein
MGKLRTVIVTTCWRADSARRLACEIRDAAGRCNKRKISWVVPHIHAGIVMHNVRRRHFYSTLSFAGAALLIGSICAAQPASSPAPVTFAVHDFTPDFWRFWEAAQNQPIEQQARLWQQLYVSRHQAVFNDLATACKDQWDATWSRTHYLPALPRVVPAIQAMVAGSKPTGGFSKRFQTCSGRATSTSWPPATVSPAARK